MSDVLLKQFTEEEIVSGIKHNVPKVYEFLYKNLTPLIYYDIRSNSGSQEDAEDHFQDTILVVAANVKAGKYVDGNIEGYIRIVSRNLWLKKLRKSVKLKQSQLDDAFDPPDEYNSEVVNDLIKHDKIIDMVNERLNEMDDRCNEILTSFYFEKRALKDIADKFQWEYSYAKKKIFMCRQKLKEMINLDHI